MAIGNAFSVAVKKARESHFTLFYEHLLRAHDVTVLFPSSRFNFRGVKCNHSGCGPGRSYGYGSLGTLAKLQPILRSPVRENPPLSIANQCFMRFKCIALVLWVFKLFAWVQEM